MRLQTSTFITTATVSSLLWSATALAQDSKPYVEVGLGYTDADFIENSDHLSGIIRGGYEMAPWAAIEAEAILGLDKGEFEQEDGDEFRVGLEHQFGGYLRLGIPIKDQFLPYIRVGIAAAKTTEERTRIRDDETQIRNRQDKFTGASFGFGVQANFGEEKNNAIRLDVTGLLSDDKDTNDKIFDLFFKSTATGSLTYVRKF